ncbi:MAG: CpXC domain-containing protein [Spirochaetales bacterium]|nr:CpXC domain-containing protein [Spirochaetales bacterium]
MAQLTCVCEHKFKAEFQSTVDAQKNPDTIKQILKGDFLTAQCPACGKVLKLEFPFKLINIKTGGEMNFVPEVDRVDTLKKLKKTKKATKLERMVIGYPELVEKLTIFELNLDDRVIEYIKYHLLSHVLEHSHEDKEIFISFATKKEDDLLFHIKGLKADEIGITKIPLSSYNQTLKDIEKKIEEEPYCDFLKPPYISINKIYTWV